MSNLVVAAATFWLLCLGLLLKNTSAGISNYVTVCDSRDPDLSECVRKRAQSMWPQLVKGIKELGLVPMEPLWMPLIQIQEGQAGSGVSVNVTDSKHFGWKDATIRSVKVDLKKNHFQFVMNFPRYQVTGNYDIRGRILVLPIVGTGSTNITIADAETTLTFDGIPEARSGKKYLRLTNVKSVMKINGKISLQMSNLFGRKDLSDAMNTFLNEHSAEVFKDFQPAIEDVSNQVYWTLLESFFKKVPYNKLFTGM